MLLTIDPGTDCCGVALWQHNGELFTAGLVRANEHDNYESGPRGRRLMVDQLCNFLGHNQVHEAVIEMPQTYRGRAARGDANDLIALGATVGGIERMLAEHGVLARNVRPSDWKGGVPKPTRVEDLYIITERIKCILNTDELSRINWPRAVRLQWDVSDAIGIGLKTIGRM